MNKEDIQKKISESGEAALFSHIIVFVFIIILLLISLLWGINRPITEDAESTDEKPVSTIMDAGKILDNLAESIEISSAGGEEAAIRKFTRNIDELTDYLNTNDVEDIKPLIYRFDTMADNLEDFSKKNSLKNLDIAVERLIREIEQLKEALENYSVRDAGLVIEKLTDVVELLKKKPCAKSVKSNIPHKRTKVKKPESITIAADDKIKKKKTEPLRMPIADRITTDGIEKEKIIKKDNILGKMLCLSRSSSSKFNNSEAPAKSIHIILNQLLIKLADINPDGTAVLDISHPRFGLRRFVLEEGTRIPFEHGGKNYYCTFQEFVNNKCINVAVYERKN